MQFQGTDSQSFGFCLQVSNTTLNGDDRIRETTSMKMWKFRIRTKTQTELQTLTVSEGGENFLHNDFAVHSKMIRRNDILC